MVQLKTDDAVILTTMESSYWTWTYYQWDRFLQVACCFRYIFIYIIFYAHGSTERQRDLDVERVRRQRRNYVYVAGRFYAPKSAPAASNNNASIFQLRPFVISPPGQPLLMLMLLPVVSQSVLVLSIGQPPVSGRIVIVSRHLVRFPLVCVYFDLYCTEEVNAILTLNLFLIAFV